MFVKRPAPFAGDERKHLTQAPRYAVQYAANVRKVLVRQDDQKKRDAAGQVPGAKLDDLAVGFVPASATTEIKMGFVPGGYGQTFVVKWASVVPPCVRG